MGMAPGLEAFKAGLQITLHRLALGTQDPGPGVRLLLQELVMKIVKRFRIVHPEAVKAARHLHVNLRGCRRGQGFVAVV